MTHDITVTLVHRTAAGGFEWVGTVEVGPGADKLTRKLVGRTFTEVAAKADKLVDAALALGLNRE